MVESFMLSPSRIRNFQKKILTHFRKEGRIFPWRETRDPYRILVSEIMLQQTQTERVRVKYAEFLEHFPTVQDLARSPLSEVIKAWQGLGYNRRALALHACARAVVQRGEFPRTPVELEELPGIGPYTASALSCFAWSHPAVFIETNIRSVYLEEFFPRSRSVSDKDILKVVAATLSRRGRREWYYALMDYGAMLKKQTRGINKRSRHYTKQSAFKGSNRQLRGQILREVSRRSAVSIATLAQKLDVEKPRTSKAVKKLIDEGFLLQRGAKLQLAD